MKKDTLLDVFMSSTCNLRVSWRCSSQNKSEKMQFCPLDLALEKLDL